MIQNISPEQKENFLRALSPFFRYCVEVDLEQDQYTLYAHRDIERFLPAKGSFSRLAAYVGRRFIHSGDAVRWQEQLSGPCIKESLAKNNGYYLVEYRFRTNGSAWEPYLCTVTALPDGSALLSGFGLTHGQSLAQLDEETLLRRYDNRKSIYRLLMEQNNTGVFEWSPPSSEEYISPNLPRKEILARGRFHISAQLIREYNLPGPHCDVLDILAENGWIHPQDLEAFEAFRGTGKPQTAYREVYCRVSCEDGFFWHKFTLMAYVQEDQLEHIIGTISDVDQETRSKLALERSNMRYRTVLRQTETIEFEYDFTTRHGYISPLLWEKYTAKPYEPTDFKDILSYLDVLPEDLEKVRGAISGAMVHHRAKGEFTCRVRNRNDRYIWCRILFDMEYDAQKKPTYLLGTLHNIDHEKRAYELLRSKAERDAVSGIWNYDKFLSAFDTLLAKGLQGRNLAVIMMDIDRFKVVNEVFGTEGGNQALRLVGDVLRTTLGNRGMYARMYADTFCITMYYQWRKDLLDFTLMVGERLARNQFENLLRPRFGIYPLTETDTGAAALVELAGYAHKEVKKSASLQWAFYDERMRRDLIERKQLENEMEQALAQEQFVLFLQPKYALPQQKIAGAEVLVRWDYPGKGIIAPGRFISMFEDNGFIIQLDLFVWEQAFRLLRKWMDEGKPVFPLSVNVSRAHIRNASLLPSLLRLTEQYRIPHSLIELEVTETMFQENQREMLAVLERMHTAGFLLAMDDFGSGYSSLNMLKDMPLDVLKIDCEFFVKTKGHRRGQTIVTHTVNMAHALDMRVVAEGVETEADAAFLTKSGCDAAQGYYFARPAPIEVFESLAFPLAPK